MSILKTLVSLCFDYSKAYNSVQTQVETVKDFISKLLSEKEQVTAEEFLKMYDLKIYDMSSKQNDIKIMKKLEFEGVYILYNKSKNKYYVGKGKKLFRKIDRHFRGYENLDVYNDFKNGDLFYVKIIKLADSDYNNIELLANDISKKYATHETGYNKI